MKNISKNTQGKFSVITRAEKSFSKTKENNDAHAFDTRYNLTNLPICLIMNVINTERSDKNE